MNQVSDTKDGDNRTAKQKIGDLGEDIAARWLRQHHYQVVGVNYLKPWGEIDIIANRGDVTHFVEVKTVSEKLNKDGSLQDREQNGFRPEENVDRRKRRRLARAIETYIDEQQIGKWQCDLICVYLDRERQRAKVEQLENIIVTKE